MATADFNHDGIPDVAVCIYATESGAVSVLMGKGDGTFAAPVDYAVGFGPTSVIAVDLNGDGILDRDLRIARRFFLEMATGHCRCLRISQRAVVPTL